VTLLAAAMPVLLTLSTKVTRSPADVTEATSADLKMARLGAGVTVAVWLGVPVGLAVRVALAVAVKVAVRLGVALGVGLAVAVALWLWVGVMVKVGDTEKVGVAVGTPAAMLTMAGAELAEDQIGSAALAVLVTFFGAVPTSTSTCNCRVMAWPTPMV